MSRLSLFPDRVTSSVLIVTGQLPRHQGMGSFPSFGGEWGISPPPGAGPGGPLALRPGRRGLAVIVGAAPVRYPSRSPVQGTARRTTPANRTEATGLSSKRVLPC